MKRVTPLGGMRLAACDEGLVGLWFDGAAHAPDAHGWREVSGQHWLDQAGAEVTAYFADDLRVFTTPRVALWGTDFQRRIWEALATLPFGVSTTYGALAVAAGSPLAVRAVGAAVGRNPWSVVVPCHRVLGAQGRLTGYAGGLDRKHALLVREGIVADILAR